MTDTATIAADGTLRFRRHTLRCALGPAGIRAEKREGDGATPAGLLRLVRVFYRADRLARPAAALPVEPLAPADGWCDDPAHADYNRRIALPHPARHEALWREDAVYDLLVTTDWNTAPVRAPLGSAIFLHLARPGLPPTEGCVALEEPALRALLADGLAALDIRP